MARPLTASPNSATAMPAVLPLAAFGLDGGIGTAANLLIVFLIAVWIALVFWTYADARRRLTDSVLIGSAALAALIFPFAGALVYAIVRPPETLDDAYERELDVRAAELRVRLLESAVKGGPGSSAHTAAVASEVSGEPAQRKPSASRPSASGQPQPSGQPRSAKPSSGASSQQGSSRRAPEPGARESAQKRGGSSSRPQSGRPARQPKPGADGA